MVTDCCSTMRMDLYIYGDHFHDESGRRLDPRQFTPAQACNHCGAPVEFFEIESGDDRMGWCSRQCWEWDNQEKWMEWRDYD